MLQRVVCGLVVLTCVAAVQSAQAESTAPVWQRVSAEGQAYQAIVLKPAGLKDAVTAKNHVLIVDTSASQVGGHRQHSLEMLDAVLAQLPADHRVRLFAIDLNAEPLSNDFAAPQSAVTTQSIKALQQRIPLGATDLIGGLKTILESLPATEPASVLYIETDRAARKPSTPRP